MEPTNAPMTRQVPSNSTKSSARSDADPSPVWVAIWLGLVVAAVNLFVYAVKHYGLARIAFVSRDVWWTLPMTNTVVFGAIGLVLAAAPLRPAARWLGALFVCTVIGATSILLNYHALQPIAVLVLATGIAVQVTRFAARHRALVNVTVRRTVGVMLLAAAAAGVVVRGSQWWGERQTLRALKPASTQVPNVLLIVLDTVRAANLSLYGYSRQTTPHLERFASGGALFTSAFSTAPWTLPSHASMLTGRWESELSADWMRPLDDRFTTLGEALERRGYSTA